jgi:hypothetical protein
MIYAFVWIEFDWRLKENDKECLQCVDLKYLVACREDKLTFVF